MTTSIPSFIPLVPLFSKENFHFITKTRDIQHISPLNLTKAITFYQPRLTHLYWNCHYHKRNMFHFQKHFCNKYMPALLVFNTAFHFLNLKTSFWWICSSISLYNLSALSSLHWLCSFFHIFMSAHSFIPFEMSPRSHFDPLPQCRVIHEINKENTYTT